MQCNVKSKLGMKCMLIMLLDVTYPDSLQKFAGHMSDARHLWL